VEREFDRGQARRIQGQILRFSEHHVVAKYLRYGLIWVADFIDNHGALLDANTWFRFNCGTLATSQARRRMLLESAVPLSAELVDRIEVLHCASDRARAETVGPR
jgi:hypothetical protein